MSERIVLITGGSRGLGRNAAFHLARAGFGVVITFRNAASEADAAVAEIEATGGRAVALALDAADTASFEGFADRLGDALEQAWGRRSFDALVNNAGFGVHASFESTAEADLDALFAVHVKGVFLLSQRLAPMLIDGGRIVNVSSGLARFTLPGYAAYAAMKGAVEVLTRYMAKELGPRGIAVNVIAPGAIETDFAGGAVRDNPEINRAIAGTIAMGRVGLPDDIGAAVAGLVASGSQWMTGQRIEVSGGQNL